jgi:hypothetical protein
MRLVWPCLYCPVFCIIEINVRMEQFNELMPWGSNLRSCSAAVCYISEIIEPNHAANCVQSNQSSWPLGMQLDCVIIILAYAWIHTSLNADCRIFHSDIVRARFLSQNSSLEASSFLAGQGILRILWSPKFDCIVYRGLPFVAALIPERVRIEQTAFRCWRYLRRKY